MKSYEDSPQTLKRFMRLAAFLENNYPNSIDSGENFKAGSALILELIRLHELSHDAAKKIASSVFSGEASVRQLHRHLEAMRAAAPPSMVHHAKRYADFSQQAIELLLKKPELLDLGGNVHFKVSEVRSTLMPKIVAHTSEGEVAVDIRTLDINAARTAIAAAAVLATRIAVLKLRYSKVVMVLPTASGEYATETLQLLKEWAKNPVELLGTVSFALVSPEGEVQHKSL